MSTSLRQVNELAYARVLARAWSDNHFRERLLNGPAEVLAENGFKVKDGTRVSIVDGGGEFCWDESGKNLTLPLPPRPANLGDCDISNLSVRADDVGVEVCCCCCCC